MKVYVLIAQLLIADTDDMYREEGKRIVAITDTIEKAKEYKETFNSLSENTKIKGIIRVIDIEEIEVNKLYSYS